MFLYFFLSVPPHTHIPPPFFFLLSLFTSTIVVTMSGELFAVSPIDGRYASKVEPLRGIFSEFGLIKNRVIVEVSWLKFLAGKEELKELSLGKESLDFLHNVLDTFSVEDAERVKEIENTTRHDVKAVEYFLNEKLQGSGIEELKSIVNFVHFACTSDDINNVSWALALKNARDTVMLPAMREVVEKIGGLAIANAGLSMMSKTHGQPATPTTLGKEMANFAYRLKQQYDEAKRVPIKAKLNGAVGNFNAHVVAYPEIDWPAWSEEFLANLGVVMNPYSTQIEPHDYKAQLFDAMSRFNTILLDFDRDMWMYISIGYFKQRKLPGEVGSSTMPHKVNPIDFENSEGNIGLANALFSFFGSKLPVSRWQRDLSDSTVLRNMGVAFGYSLIAYSSVVRGLNKVHVNDTAISEDLDKHWELLAEPIQTVMRKYNIEHGYEKMKEVTQGKVVTHEDMSAVINSETCAKIPEEERKQLLSLTPSTYIGTAPTSAKNITSFLVWD
eukprot:m.38347 g.38347  ORF g.38347 m.38347 type:complete len:499 (+) comp6792_c0_seq2:137-1633(+)